MAKNPLKLSVHSLVAMLIVMLTLAKIAFIIFQDPVYGYANNYDFVRKSSCVGIWQKYESGKKTDPHPRAPVNSLVYDNDRMTDICAKSSDNLLVHILRHLHTEGDAVDFREISALRFLALAVMMFFLVYLAEHAAVKLWVAMLFYFEFGDINNQLYFNTLYDEVSVLAGGFFSVLGIVLLAAPGVARAGAKDRLLLLLLVLALLWLGFSKQQFTPLASALALWAAAEWFVRQRPRYGWMLLLCAMTMPVVYALANKDNVGLRISINMANKTNTFMAAVLPEVEDRQQALADLGLPDSCLAAIGRSWYDPGVAQNHACPALKDVSRLRLVPLFVREPQAFFRPFLQGLAESHLMYPRYLGFVEHPSQLQSKTLWLASLGSFSKIMSELPRPAYMGITLGVMLTGLVAFMACCRRLIQPPPTNHSSLVPAIATLMALGGWLVFYSILSSVFGDGYFDLQKHTALLGLGLMLHFGGVLLWAADKSSKLSKNKPFLAHLSMPASHRTGQS